MVKLFNLWTQDCLTKGICYSHCCKMAVEGNIPQHYYKKVWHDSGLWLWDNEQRIKNEVSNND